MKKILIFVLCAGLIPVLATAANNADADTKTIITHSGTEYIIEGTNIRSRNPSSQPYTGPRATPTVVDTLFLDVISLYCFGITYDWDRDALWLVQFLGQNNPWVYCIAKTSPTTKIDSFQMSGAPYYTLGLGYGGSDILYVVDYANGMHQIDIGTGAVTSYRALNYGGIGCGFNTADDAAYTTDWGVDQCAYAQPAQTGAWNTWSFMDACGASGAHSASSPAWLFTCQEEGTQSAVFNQHALTGGVPNTTPDSSWDVDPAQDHAYLADCAFDGQYVYIIDQGDPDRIFVYDVGIQLQPNILFVDDDAGNAYETYWEASFTNLAYPYDKWVVSDSGDVAPTAAQMGAYNIVVWTTGYDWSTTLTPTDTTEIGNYLTAGGCFWLGSQDVLYDIGTVGWMHISSFSSDVGCLTATGIGPVMNGTSFGTTAGVFTDYADWVVPDGISWTEMTKETGDTNTVAHEDGGCKFFFNAFGFENINNTADQDTMMERVIQWFLQPPPDHDVGTTVIDEPATMFTPGTIDPTATYRNFGSSQETFDIYFLIDTGGVNLYTETANVTVDALSDTTHVFPSFTGVNGITYDITAYTVMGTDTDPSNDTLTQSSYCSSEMWIQCANQPTAELANATGYDPLNDRVYSFGGSTSGGTGDYQDCTYQYDPTTDTWATMANMPNACDWIDASYSNDRFYIFGGYNGAANNWNMIYDISSDVWSTGAVLPDVRHSGCQVVYNDSLVYYMGGRVAGGALNTVLIYNIYADTWTTGTVMPVTQQKGNAVICDSVIYLVGGWDAGGAALANLYIGVIDPSACETITWSTGSALPYANAGEGVSVYYDTNLARWYIFMVGGFQNGSTPVAEAWMYDVTDDTWSSKPDYPFEIARCNYLTSRQGYSEIYVCAGDDYGDWGGTDQVWKLPLNIPGVSEKPYDHGVANPTFGFAPMATIVNNRSKINYTTTTPGIVSLTVYDRAGRLVETLVNKFEEAGTKSVIWNVSNIANGVYFIRIEGQGESAHEKLVIVK
jgi:N-acetylneuraminic acid mutarotase